MTRKDTMPVKNKTITVYPSPVSAEILGGYSSPGFNLAIECWAEAIRRATPIVASALDKSDWKMLADTLNGHASDANECGYSLAVSVTDSHELEQTGTKWYGKQVASRVRSLADKLRAMHYAEAQAIVWAVRWFWEHHQRVDADDPWWDIMYRRKKQIEWAKEK